MILAFRRFQQGFKIQAKINQKCTCFVNPILDRFLINFSSIFGGFWLPKSIPKSIQKSIEKSMDFGIDFWWFFGSFLEPKSTQNPSKIVQKTIQKNIEKKSINKEWGDSGRLRESLGRGVRFHKTARARVSLYSNGLV